MFATFFSDKIQKLDTVLTSSLMLSSPHTPLWHTTTNLSVFSHVTGEEVSNIIYQSSNTFCGLDPIPISFLEQCLSAHLPTLTTMINMSLSTGVFPDECTACSVIPLLKKCNLDKEDLFNYRPMSYLSLLSKLTERVVKNRLTQHISGNNLLNQFNLPTLSTIQLSPHFLLFMITSYKLCLNNKSQLYVSWICLLPSIPSINFIPCIAYLLGLALMAKWYPGSLHICHFVVSLLLSTQIRLLNLLSVRVSRKDQSSVFSYSFSLKLLSVLLYLTLPLVIICVLMTTSFSFLLSPLNFPPKLHTCKPQLILSVSGCLWICWH